MASAREGRLIGVSLELERASKAREQADTERGVLPPEGGRGFLEELAGTLVGESRPPAARLEPDCRAGEQLSLPEVSRDLSRLAKGLQRVERPAGAEQRGTEVEQDLGASALVRHAHLQGRAQARSGLVVRQRG